MQYETDPDERPLSPRDRDEAAAEAAKIRAEAGDFWSKAEAGNQRVRITRVITYEGPADCWAGRCRRACGVPDPGRPASSR